MTVRQDLQWFDGYIENPERATDEQVNDVEELLGVRLPPDYIAVVREHQGQYCEPSQLEMIEGGSSLGYLLHFDLSEQHKRKSIVGYPASPGLYDSVPDAVPISYDAGGNYLAFDYGKDRKKPPIIFWDHETGAVQFVANNFTELLDKMTPL